MTPTAVEAPLPDPGDAGLQRLRLDLAYDGTDFAGWARQPGLRTVEGVLAEAIGTASRMAEPPRLVVAGRTDAGVHAVGQVAHLDLAASVVPAELTRRLRGLLPADVVVHAVSAVPAAFDARFAALARTYRYRICDGPPDPLRRRDTLIWPRPLDPERMHAAGQGLVGEHDFAAFCRPRPGSTTVRTLRRLDVRRTECVISVEVEADAFCHNQVRAMVGALLAVGDGRRPLEWPAEVLARGRRDPAVTVASAHGLTLMGVEYPADELLAARAAITRSRRSDKTS